MFEFTSDHSASGTASSIINRPVDDVFKFIGVDFFENYPRWSPEVIVCELLSDPPLRLNSLARQVRIDHGQRSESTFRVTCFDPLKKLTFEGVSNPYRCFYDFKEGRSPEQTEITFTFELLRLELFMLPFEKLIQIAVRDGAHRTVRNLKTLLES